MAQDDPIRESARFSFAPDFAGMELLTARYFAHRFTPHVHDTYAIALIEHGAERFRCGRAEGIAPAGSIIVIPPGEVHTGQRGGESGWAYRALYPAPQVLAALMAELRDGSDAPLNFGTVVLTDRALFQSLHRLHTVLHEEHDLLLRAGAWREAMGDLLVRHGGASQPRVGRETAAVRTAQELLRADEGAALTLDAVARAVGLSPWHFNRAFSSEVGLPPHAWRNQWRLAQAKTLLRRGQAPVEVAAALGYADQSHLHRHFKRAFGVTPGAYGKNVQDARPQTR